MTLNGVPVCALKIVPADHPPKTASVNRSLRLSGISQIKSAVKLWRTS